MTPLPFDIAGRQLEVRALDNLPPRLALRDPMLLSSGATIPILRVSPLGEDDDEARMTVRVDALRSAPRLKLETSSGRPLIGFVDPERPPAPIEARTVGASPLLASITIDPYEQAATLALDLGGLSALWPDDLRSEDARPIENDQPILERAANAAATVLASVTIAQVGAGARRGVTVPIEIAFSLSPEPWAELIARIDLRALASRRALGRLDPPTDPRPEILAFYPEITDHDVDLAVAEVAISAPGAAPLLASRRARLELETPDHRLAGALYVAKHDDEQLRQPGDHLIGDAALIRDAAAKIDNREDILSDASAVQLTSGVAVGRPVRRLIMLQCGTGGVVEPDRVLEEPLVVRLVADDDETPHAQSQLLARSAEHLLRLAPPTDPPSIAFQITESESFGGRSAPQRSAASPMAQNLELNAPDPIMDVVCSERRIARSGENEEASATLLALDMTLLGNAPPGAPIRVEASVEILDAAGAPIPALSRNLATRYAQRDGESVHRAILSTRARFAHFSVTAPNAHRIYAEALNSIAPGGGFHSDGATRVMLRSTLTLSGARTGRAVFTRPLRIVERARQKTLAIDFGAESVAAALTDDAGAARLLPLSNAMRGYGDRMATDDQAFISSAVSVDPKDCWRADVFPESLWASTPDATAYVDPIEAAKALDRAYAIASPPIGRDQAPSRAVVDTPLSRLFSEGSFQTRKPVWSSQTDPELSVDISIEHLTRDALHELIDFHLGYDVGSSEAIGARLTLVHPTQYGPRPIARLKAAADRASDRLRVEAKGSTSVTLIPAADAAAAHLLNCLPIDERPVVRAIIYDLGARTLDLALIEATQAAPGVAAEIDEMRVLARGGASIGGASIDLVLYFIIDAALSRLSDHAAAAYRHRLIEPIDWRSDDARAHWRAKRRMVDAILNAKMALSTACRAAASMNFGWPDEIMLSVQVGAVGAGTVDWPVHANSAINDPITLAQGVVLRRVDGRLTLEMTKAAVERPAMRDLMRFLGEHALRPLFNRENADIANANADETSANDRSPPRHAPAVDLIVSGRAAQWPLIYEALAETIAAGGVAERFAFAQLPSDRSLKSAAALGAAWLTKETRDPLTGDGGGRYVDATSPPRYALLGVERDIDSVQQIRSLTPETEFERLMTCAGRLHLVETPPGLSAHMLQNTPWATSLLAPTGFSADGVSLSDALSRQPLEIRRRANGGLSLSPDAFSTEGPQFDPAPALPPRFLDVTENDAPPGFPASVRLD